LLQIRGYHLPGRVWQSHDQRYDNVHVGIQVGKEPRELVRGDAEMCGGPTCARLKPPALTLSPD
jgi:hypothetical protein